MSGLLRGNRRSGSRVDRWGYSRTWDLWLWDFESQELVQLTDTRFIEQSPLWNAAGTEIVYAAFPDGNKDIWVAYDLPVTVPVARQSMSGLKALFR